MTSILVRLKQATQPLHDRIESAMPLMRPGFTRYDYICHLKLFYGFFAPWEIAVETRLDQYEIDFYRARRKRHLLEQDLLNLGVLPQRIAAIPRCLWTPPLTSVPKALGSLYVLEGSTLGGQVIRKHLQQSLGLDDSVMAYYGVYGRDTSAHWKAFGQFLEAHALPDVEAIIIQSACDTFAALYDWLAGRELLAA